MTANDESAAVAVALCAIDREGTCPAEWHSEAGTCRSFASEAPEFIAGLAAAGYKVVPSNA